MKTIGLKPALIITFLVQALALAATTLQAGDFTILTGIQLAGALINLAGVIFVGPGQVTDQPDAPEPPHPELPHDQPQPDAPAAPSPELIAQALALLAQQQAPPPPAQPAAQAPPAAEAAAVPQQPPPPPGA